MKTKLSNADMVEITKALKNGYLDMSKVTPFKDLLDNYRPLKHIGDKELNYYLKCLHDGWGYKPTDRKEVERLISDAINEKKLGEEYQEGIENGQLYNLLAKTVFEGLVAIRALGGTFTDVEGDFSFIERGRPIFE